MRHETAHKSPRPITLKTFRPEQFRRIGLIGLAGSILFLALLLAAPPAFSESSSSVISEDPASPAAPDFFVDEKSDETELSVLTTPPPRAESLEESRPLLALEALFDLRTHDPGPRRPQTIDEALADAVASGSNPDLEPKNPFRKRSLDLFRTEQPVSIGNADMLLRLRVRAKLREAMSVELHF